MTEAYKAKVIKALPQTADGFAIFPGMAVYMLLTNDGGLTWHVSPEHTVWDVAVGGLVRMSNAAYWNFVRAVGDNRIFRSAKAANAERVRRNRAFAAAMNKGKSKPE